MSQAPGLSGTPCSGHCSSAATSASCARSSATATSRTMRVSPAISRADSIRQTASIARWVADAVTPAAVAVELAQLELDAAVERRALEPLERLLARRALPDPEAGDQLLGLGERAVDDGALPALEAHARALGARVQAVAGEHHAGLDELLVVLRHRVSLLRVGSRAASDSGSPGTSTMKRIVPPRGDRGSTHTSNEAGAKPTRCFDQRTSVTFVVRVVTVPAAAREADADLQRAGARPGVPRSPSPPQPRSVGPACTCVTAGSCASSPNSPGSCTGSASRNPPAAGSAGLEPPREVGEEQHRRPVAPCSSSTRAAADLVAEIEHEPVQPVQRRERRALRAVQPADVRCRGRRPRPAARPARADLEELPVLDEGELALLFSASGRGHVR